MKPIDMIAPGRGRRTSGGFARFLLIVALLAIAGTGLWTWFSLSWAYSDGTRAGVLQKISRRGWICKTEEGELAQYVVAGVSPQIWQFSVRDPKLGAQLAKLVGARVQLHYTEHAGVPTVLLCRHPLFRRPRDVDFRTAGAGRPLLRRDPRLRHRPAPPKP